MAQGHKCIALIIVPLRYDWSSCFFFYFLRLLSKLPNSYAFTKALGEALAVEAMEHIPVIILRPSIGKLENVNVVKRCIF